MLKSNTGCLFCGLFFHLLQLLRVSSANKIALHVVNVAFGVHQVLLGFAFDLNPPHHDVVLHVNALLVILASFLGGGAFERVLAFFLLDLLDINGSVLDRRRLLRTRSRLAELEAFLEDLVFAVGIAFRLKVNQVKQVFFFVRLALRRLRSLVVLILCVIIELILKIQHIVLHEFCLILVLLAHSF